MDRTDYKLLKYLLDTYSFEQILLELLDIKVHNLKGGE